MTTNLITRLSEGSGADRELDAEIMFDLFAKPVGKKDDGGPSGYLWPEDDPSWSFGIRFPGKDREWFSRPGRRTDKETLLLERDGALVLMNDLRIPRLTSSLDACRALHDRLFPGSEFDMTTLYGVARVGINLNTGSPSYGSDEGGDICRAWLIAILTAKAEQ